MNSIAKALRSQKEFFLVPYGSSMFPILQSKDKVYYKNISFNNVRVNDLILVAKNHHLFTHRVIYKTKKYIITKGDNNRYADGKIYEKNIVGKVYQVKRNRTFFHPENLYLFQSTLYFQEIVKIKKALEREKIDLVFLKGLPLHMYYEKSHPRRLYLDCDVLIKRRNFVRVKKLLQKYKYRQSNNLLSTSIKRNGQEEIELSYYKFLNGLSISFDLHFEVDITIVHLNKLDLLYPQKLINNLTNDFFNNIRMVKIQGEFFPILSDENLILYLGIHFFHHNYRGAFRLEFLDKIWRGQSSLRTDLIIEKIKDYKLQNFIYPVFFMLKKYYQTPIPADFMQEIQPVDPLIRKIVNKLMATYIFDDEPRVTSGINRFKNLFFLSPRPLLIRLLVFLNPQIMYSIFWVFQRRLSSFFSNRK